MRLWVRLALSYALFVVITAVVDLFLAGLYFGQMARRFAAHVPGGQPTVIEKIHIAGLGLLLALIGATCVSLALAAVFGRSLARPLDLLAARLTEIGTLADSATPAETAPSPGAPSTPAPAQLIPVAPGARDEIATVARAYNRLVARLAAAEAERLRAEQARRDLVANLSHDLRTPLTSLRGFAEALADQPDADPSIRRRYAEVIGRRAAEIDELLGDLIELSRLQSVPALNRVPTDLAEVTREALIPFADDAASAGIELQVDLPDHLPPAPADPALIRRAVGNLVANVLRHARGATRLRVSLRCAGSDALIRFADDGPGIPPEVLPRLFDRYYRGTSATEHSPGTGLGLAIVRQIALAHGGDVTGENAPTRGAVFTLRLPL